MWGVVNYMVELTEDQVRDLAGKILGFNDPEEGIQEGVGQLTTFNNLGFKGVLDKPDGWYLPDNGFMPAIILEAKSSRTSLRQAEREELIKNIQIANTKYSKVIGILYNGIDVVVYKNDEEIEAVNQLQNKKYYLALYNNHKIDKQHIYNLTKKINDCLHKDFGIKNLYHRMIFTACALVAKRYGASLNKGMNYPTFHTSIHSTLSKSLEESRKQNQKLDTLLEVYSEIKMNNKDNQEAIDNFIEWVTDISESINSDDWNGEDVMGIFFNEFNRYKPKSESGQVFTPDHITSLMYRLINVNKDDYVLDAACGSGAFLVKSMCNMMREAGGIYTDKAKQIKSEQLYGIEFDREIFALACANMLIHKDGKTNLELLDTRMQKACQWIESKKITKVLMNPPFENKYGCMNIVENVLNSVPQNTMCAFILPDKKLEKVGKTLVDRIIKNHRLLKIIKLPEKTFSEGITTSIFIWQTGVPQNNKDIFTCYIEEDGLVTVKNQGRQDIYNKWPAIEDKWVDIIYKQSGHDTIKWISPSDCLSYQVPPKEFEISEEDFRKTILDYYMYEEEVNIKEFEDKIIYDVLYSSKLNEDDNIITITIPKGDGNE